MDNKRTLLGMIVALLLVGGWLGAQWLVDKRHPEWAEARAKKLAEESSSTQPITATPAPAAPETAEATTVPSITAGLHVVEGDTNPAHVALGSAVAKDQNWAMQLELTPVGAGVRQVTLNQFQKAVKDPSPYSFEQPYADHPGTEPLGTSFIEIDGSTLDISTASWNLQSQNPSDGSATYSLLLALPRDQKTVRLSKTFTLPRRGTLSLGYDVSVNYAIENLSGRDLKISTGFNGPTIPPKEVERGADRQIIAGYNEGSSIRVVQHVAEEFKDKTPKEISQDKNQPVVWAGAGSVYFDALILPVASSTKATPEKYSVSSTALAPENQDYNDIKTSFTTGTIALEAGKTAQLPLSVYFGPKMRNVFETPYYSAFPRMFDKTLIIGSSYCAICTFPKLVAALVWLLSFFHGILRDWGLAIIALVCLVRLILHPITKKSQVYMMRMGKMGPEMERLKKKYADDKDALNKAMMQFYKEQGMAPVLGCLPMFLQMPIWIALWTALQSTFELRLSPFLWFGHVHLTWIADLARPDALISFPTITIPFVNFQIDSFNLLPILMGGVMFLQQKYTPKPVAATPEQAQQQKMMTWMSTLLFPIFLYKGPAGLNLYIFASTAAGIIESKIIRDHIKQREEAEKAGRVFVETKPTRGARRGANDLAAPKKPPGKLASWLAELQAKAEQIKREGGNGK